MQSYHVSHVGRASRIGSHYWETPKPLGCSAKAGRKETGRQRKGVQRRIVSHWGHRAGAHPLRGENLLNEDTTLEILLDELATMEETPEQWLEESTENEASIQGEAQDYAELSPDTELIWIRDSDEGDNDRTSTARNLAEADEMFESLNRDSRSETGDPEKASDRIGAQSVQSENDAHQDIETAVRSVVNRLPPPIEQKHPASMPPVPGQGAARSSLAVRSLTRASERADKLVDELQIVRSSIPPVHRRRLRRNRMFFNIAAAAMIIFAFIVTVMLTAVFRDQSENLVTVVPQQQMETAIVANRPDIAEVAPSEQEDAETSAMVFSVDEIAAGLPASNENPVSELTSVQPSFTSEQATKSEEMEDAGNYTRTGEARRKAPTVKKESTSTVGDPTPLPKSPSRESVERAMTRISRQVEKCRLDQTGRMVVEITFAGATGEVTDARILGQEFQGTDVGRCVLQAVRAARVSSFQNATEVIKYPFAL